MGGQKDCRLKKDFLKYSDGIFNLGQLPLGYLQGLLKYLESSFAFGKS